MSAIVDIGVMQCMINLGINALSAASTGFFAGLVLNYIFHAKVTFRAQTNLFNSVRFIIVVGINYSITIAFVATSLAICASALVGKIISLPVVAVNGFMLSRHWVFK